MLPKLILAVGLAAPSVASAHIQLMDPVPRTTMQKEQHCGDPTAPRRAPRVLVPGSKFTVMWLETVDHPGHYRISFDLDGSDFFIPPNTTATTVGLDPTVMIDLIPDVQGNLPIAGRMYMQEITLPNVECANCTLQVIQLMTDKPPYTTDTLSDDVYFQCADIQLSNSAPPPMVDAGVPPAGDASTTDPGATNGGCSASGGGGGGSLALVALGLVVARRRRRR